MFGHLQSQRRQFEHLPFAHRFHCRLAQVVLAVGTTVHRVQQHHVWRCHRLQCFPFVPQLSAAFSLALFPLALGGGLFQPVAARRLAAVAAVLGELRLQFSDLGAQALDHLPLFADNG